MDEYPNPDLFDPTTCPYCREARAIGVATCTRHRPSAPYTESEEADVTPTIPCPDCNGDGIDGSDDAARFYAYSGKLSTCDTCDGMGTVSAPIVAPVLSGDDPTYKEWRPT